MRKKPLLMRRGDIKWEYGVSRHHLEQAVKDGKLEPYAGLAAKKWKQYFRVDVEALAKELNNP